jgi:hypothetical protein
MAQFKLGAALLFEELTGKSMTDIKDPKITDMIYLFYAQEYWDKNDRPSFDDFKKEISQKDISEIGSALNGPFSPKEVQ